MSSSQQSAEATPYRPSAFYFREAIRKARNKKQCAEVGLILVSELEQLKAWVREQGMVPPRWHMLPEEAADKADLRNDLTPEK